MFLQLQNYPIWNLDIFCLIFFRFIQAFEHILKFKPRDYYIYVGAHQIQDWTKESLREKPFSTVKGKIWTETPSSIPLDKIFTKLQWVKKNRETYGTETEELDDITQILSEGQLGTKWILCACFRVRVQKLFLSSRPLPVRRSAVAF